MIFYNEGKKYALSASWRRWYSSNTKKFYAKKSQAALAERRQK